MFVDFFGEFAGFLRPFRRDPEPRMDQELDSMLRFLVLVVSPRKPRIFGPQDTHRPTKNLQESPPAKNSQKSHKNHSKTQQESGQILFFFISAGRLPSNFLAGFSAFLVGFFCAAYSCFMLSDSCLKNLQQPTCQMLTAER